MLEKAEKSRRVLERIVRRRGSLRGAGRSCGRSTMWFWRQLRQNKSVDLVKTEKVLDQLGVPMRFFYEEMRDETSDYDPIWLLEHFREENGYPRDPFLEAIQGRLTRLFDQRTAPGGNRRREEVDELDETRYFSRDKAKQGLEALALQILATIEATPVLRRGPLADMARILLIWGAIQRGRGHFEDCIDGYLLAYKLAVAGHDLKSVGAFYNYASYLLAAELKHPLPALRFAEQSCLIYQQFRDRDLSAQGLIATGIALYRLNRFDEQRTRLIAALRVVQRKSWACRAAAWIQLSNLAIVRGNRRAALGKIQRAQKWSNGCKYLEAFLYLREAYIWRDMDGQVEAGRTTVESARAFRQAIQVFGEAGEDYEVILAVVDLVEMLVSVGRITEAATEARARTPLFERLDGGTQVYSQWLDLLALILRGTSEASLQQAVLLRETLQAEAPKVRLRLSH